MESGFYSSYQRKGIILMRYVNIFLIFFSLVVSSGAVYEFSNDEDEKRFNKLLNDISVDMH